MKSIVNKLALASTFLTTIFMSVTGVAQTMIHVPFNFTVGSQTLPAGAYAVESSPRGGFVTLKSTQNPTSFSWTVSPGDPAPTDSRVVLNFNQVGKTHILRSVQYHSQITLRLDEKTLRYNHRSASHVQGQ